MYYLFMTLFLLVPIGMVVLAGAAYAENQQRTPMLFLVASVVAVSILAMAVVS
jgi:hypothetical protein